MPRQPTKQKDQNIMKLSTLIGVAALLATVTVHAQQSGYPLMPVPITLPSVVLAANSPTNFATPVVIDMKKIDVTTVYFTVSSRDAASTTNVTFTGGWSGDGVNIDTNNFVTLTANVLAGKVSTTCTNTLTRSGRRYFVIYSESIGANSAVTNNSAGYSQISSPW
jgi:hypothetical protein